MTTHDDNGNKKDKNKDFVLQSAANLQSDHGYVDIGNMRIHIRHNKERCNSYGHTQKESIHIRVHRDDSHVQVYERYKREEERKAILEEMKKHFTPEQIILITSAMQKLRQKAMNRLSAMTPAAAIPTDRKKMH